MKEEIREFFEAYNKSFEQSPAEIAKFYHEPCITARMGTANLNVRRADAEAFFAAALEKYRARGWVRGEIKSVRSERFGQNSALAVVDWAYKDKENKTIWEWTFSYNLYRQDGGWKIILQTLHDS